MCLSGRWLLPGLVTDSTSISGIITFDHNNTTVEEAKVLACFRKKYVSIRKVDLKRGTTTTAAAAATDGAVVNDAATAIATTTPTATNTTANGLATPTTTPLSKDTESPTTTWYANVEFGGPIRIKGPAKRMCSLLSGAFVVAREVHLTRGRRRRGAARTNGATTSRGITGDEKADAAALGKGVI